VDAGENGRALRPCAPGVGRKELKIKRYLDLP